MKKLLQIAIILGFIPTILFAPMGVYAGRYFELLPPLQYSICEWETRGKKKPHQAVSWKDATAWGRCQVKYYAAIAAGYPRKAHPAALFEPLTNLIWSEKILQHCEKKLARRGIRRTPVTISDCYGTGKIRKKPPTTRLVPWWSPKTRRRELVKAAAYSKQIASNAADWRLDRLMAEYRSP